MITQRDIRNLKPTKERSFKKGCSNGLFVFVQKVFVGKDIIHAAIYKRNDIRTIYNMIYGDG